MRGAGVELGRHDGDDVDVAALGLVVAEGQRAAHVQSDDEAGYGRVERVEVPVDRLRGTRRERSRHDVSVSGGRYRKHTVALDRFTEPVRAWFETSFAAPTDAQVAGWPAIAAGDHTLLLAPTGSGKTLAAFLWAIDRLGTAEPVAKDRRTRVVYVSPLRALAFDIEKNLRAPLAGITLAAERLGTGFTAPTVALRTGDTPGKERQQLVRNPPDILITTPESLYLMLTSRARETLRGVETVIIDEIHALAPTKRGAHLMLSLERLEAITEHTAAAHWALGDAATARRDGALPRRADRRRSAPGHDRRRGLAEGTRRRSDRAGRRHERTVDGSCRESGSTAPRPTASIWPHVHPAHSRAHPRAPNHNRVLQRAPARRTARPRA